MNTQQRKYAIERINTLIGEKKAAIRAKHYQNGTSFGTDEMREALRKGEFTVKEGYFGRRADLCEVVKFNGEKPDLFNEEACNKETAEMLAEAAKIKDQLMLGDAQQALEAIEKFRDFA